jgi:hypothetical protein
MGPDRPRNQDCAGKGQQQFTRDRVCLRMNELVNWWMDGINEKADGMSGWMG